MSQLRFSRFFGRGRLFEGGVYSRGSVYFKIRDFRGAFIRGGAFILKSEILGGRLFEGAFIRGGAFTRGNTVPLMKTATDFHQATETNKY